MAEAITIDLKGRIAGGASIEFLQAGMNRTMPTSLAHIRYALAGVEQQNGLRIDLDKRVIFDRFNDPAKDAVISRATPELADLLGTIAEIRDELIATEDAWPEHRGLSLEPNSFLLSINRLHFVYHYRPDEIAKFFGFSADAVAKVTEVYRKVPVNDRPPHLRPLERDDSLPLAIHRA